MAPAVVFPDIVALVIGYLADVEPELTLDTARRRPRGLEPVVVIRRNGGALKTLVSDDAYLEVDVYLADGHDAQEVAHDVAQRVSARLRSLTGSSIDGTAIYHVRELSRPALLPDDQDERGRWNFTPAVHYRGTSI